MNAGATVSNDGEDADVDVIQAYQRPPRVSLNTSRTSIHEATVQVTTVMPGASKRVRLASH